MASFKQAVEIVIKAKIVFILVTYIFFRILTRKRHKNI